MGARTMTPKPPPGFELIDDAIAPPAPPPGFQLIDPQEKPSRPAGTGDGSELRAYEPTWRDRVGQFLSDILGNSPEAERVVSGAVGSTGLGHNRTGVVDFTPARIPLFAQEAKRAYDAGNTGQVVLNAIGATPIPVLNKGVDAAASALRPVADAASRAMTAASARLPEAITGRGADDVADAVIAGRLQRSGQSAATVAEDLSAGQRSARLESNSNATLPETIADTSQDMQRLTGSVYRTGGEAGEIIKPALVNRQRGPANPYAPRDVEGPQGQIERIIDDFDRALGVKSSKGARATSAELEAAQRAKANELYAKARENSEPFDLENVATAWHVKAQDYQGAFRQKLVSAIDLFTQPAGSFTRPAANNITRFDNAKKMLDDMIESSKGEFGKATNLTRELTNLKNDLIAEVHRGGRNKFYQQARDEFGTAAENREAIDLGRKAMREDSEVSVETYRNLTPAQQKLFRIGMRDSVRLTMATKKPGDNATLPFQQRRVRELLSEVIPTPKGRSAEFADRPARFGDIMRREERMSETNNRVLGNSATAERVGDDAEFASDALSRALTGGRSMVNMGLEMLGGTLQRAFGYRRDVAAALARKLMDSNPQSRAATLEAIKAAESPQAFSEFADGIQKAFPRAVPPLTPAATAERPSEPRREFPRPMYLGGPKPDDSLPGVPQGIDGEPGPSSNEMNALIAAERTKRADNALLRYGDTTIIPSWPEIGWGSLDAMADAGDVLMAFGPMGEALNAPIAGTNALLRSMRAKPSEIPIPPLTLEEEGARVAGIVSRRKQAERVATTAKTAAQAKASGSTGTVPATANRRALVDEINAAGVARPVKGRQGAMSVDDQISAIESQGQVPILNGPWGPDLKKSIASALEKSVEARKALDARQRSTKVMREPHDMPSVADAYRNLRSQVRQMQQQIGSSADRIGYDRGVKLQLRNDLRAAQEELLRLQKKLSERGPE